MVIANKYITKMSIKLNDSERITGSISGAIMGVLTYTSFSEILITCGVAILTGLCGALGAHLFKIIKEKLKLNKNG